MTSTRTVVQRTCLAFAVRLCRNPPTSPFLLHPATTSATRLFSTSSEDFQPPLPPTSKGIPVYPDIDFNVAKDSGSEGTSRNEDPNAIFVVNGSSRGIGLQFVKSLMDRTQGSIVACCRAPDAAAGLQEYVASLSSSARDRIHLVTLDLEDQSSIEAAAATIGDDFGRIDLLLNVAGLLGDGSTTPGPERSLAKLDRNWVEKTMAINVIGPVMLSKELAPFMKTKRSKDNRAKSVIANLSARVGSIADNEMGGWYSYRFSKAALNQATRTMAHELKRQGTWSVALHPGTTNTDLSKPFQKNVADGRLFPVDFTTTQLLDVIDSMEDVHSGGFYDWAGKALPF